MTDTSIAGTGRVDAVDIEIYPGATCQDAHCDWAFPRLGDCRGLSLGPRAGRIHDAARSHVDDTGHSVLVERITRTLYTAGKETSA